MKTQRETVEQQSLRKNDNLLLPLDNQFFTQLFSTICIVSLLTQKTILISWFYT